MQAGRGRPQTILQIGSIDQGGGAAAVASDLGRAFRERGCRVWYAVGQKCGTDADAFLVPNDHRRGFKWSGYSAVHSALRQLAGRHPNRGWGLAARSLRLLTHPRVRHDRAEGLEDFEFPGTYGVLERLDGLPDIVHCHNLHGGYFDLRALAWLSERVPTVMTLHDMWLLTGHCAHSIGCDRWKAGCGSCPDLNLYPRIHHDGTRANWERKRDIYRRSRLYVATPSQWLLDQVEQSMLMPAVRNARVVPNGIDLDTFQPGDQQAARASLGIPQDVAVVLMTVGSRGSMWKDDSQLVSTMKRIERTVHELPVLFLALGRDATIRPRGCAQVRMVPYQSDPRAMATYYQAADVYAHAARADTFPSAILEAMACGTPVVATRVGGIPEQIRSADVAELRARSVEGCGEATGVVVPARDGVAMAEAIMTLLWNGSVRRRLGENGIRDARARFDRRRQAEAYLEWYQAVARDWETARDGPVVTSTSAVGATVDAGVK